MDSLQMKKFQAINSYRKQRILNKIVLYSFTSLTCILFLSSPLWYPLLRAFVKSLLFVSIPKLGALFFSSKCIFLLGNLIVIFLVGESKIFKSRSSSSSSSSSSSLPSNVLKQKYAAHQENVLDEKNFIFVAGESKISRSKYTSSLPFSVNLEYGPEQEEEFCRYEEVEKERDEVKGNYCMNNFRENEELMKFNEFKYVAAEAEPNELSKRADDFIARVNKQIRLEAYLAYEYARRGACLTIAARREKSLREVAERALDLGAPDVLIVPADVSKVEDCRRIVDRNMSHYGQLDHLVNNAGIATFSPFEEIEDITNMRSIMDINFWGSVYITKFAIPYLRYSQGRIIVISSVASWLPAPRMCLYSASKAAMVMFFEALRIEFGQDIKITLVTPGFVESEITQGKFINKTGKVEVNPQMRDVGVGITPVLKAEECAKAIVHGACRGERYITVPSWFKFSYLWKVLCPEVVEWFLRLMYLSSRGVSPEDAPTKKMLDYTGVRKVLYPDYIRELEPKAE